MSDQTLEGAGDELKPIAEAMPNAPVAPAHGIAAIALSMAMKYHDINHVHDGQLYQQYKLEGRNIQPLHLDWVLDTASKIEKWLLASSDRIAKIVVDAIAIGIEDEPDVEETEPDAEEDSNEDDLGAAPAAEPKS